MLSILNFFYSVIPNYGVAILLLTLLVRVVLHPLTRSGQVSMHKMQLLQPKILELRKKYGDDRQKMAQEQFALYRKYGVHPLSGCLPLALQMPVFIALFMTLRQSVQLRHAPFIPGWVNDLSQPDTVWHLPWFLPIFGNELNILPFLMVATWIGSQWFTPVSADPQVAQQQKIMKWMPIFFALLFYRMASGLVLYWTASSGLGMIEQWLIRRSLANVKLVSREEEEAHTSRDKSAPTDTRKAGWFDRMVERFERQQKLGDRARRRKKDD
jgi:YidC/Oxa1 family membrane protein insertase